MNGRSITGMGLVALSCVGTAIISTAPVTALPANTVTPVAVPGLPPGTSAVLTNLAMVDATAAGYITADRCSSLTATPQTRASGNHPAGRTAVANLSVVPVDPDGRFCIYSQSPVELVADVQGAFAPASAGGDLFVPASPRRLLDTRAGGGPPAAAGSITPVVTGAPAGADAVLVNLAMVDATAPGYITADRCSNLTATPQTRANGNHPSGPGAVANLSVVPVDPDGRFCIYNQSPVHLVADIQGSFHPDGPTAAPGGLGFESSTAGRALDTRSSNGLRVPPGSITPVVTGAPAGADAVLVNLAMVDATAPGYITADRCSNLTATPQTRANGNHPSGPGAVANLSVVPVDPDGRFCIYNQSPVHLVADIQGSFHPDGAHRFVPMAPTRLLDTRPPVPPSVPGTTSCQSVVHIGDSTSVGMIHTSIIKDPANRLPAQYSRVSVENPRMEISGARSIVETLSGQENAYQVASRVKASGYEGCWVLALGTTDTANIAAGSGPGRAWRVDRMMSVIGDDPVLWVNVRTLVATGPWSNAAMQLWNNALAETAAKYPNIVIYDWASVVQRSWFSGDAVHYTPEGYRIRAALIADALAAAFPA